MHGIFDFLHPLLFSLHRACYKTPTLLIPLEAHFFEVEPENPDMQLYLSVGRYTSSFHFLFLLLPHACPGYIHVRGKVV